MLVQEHALVGSPADSLVQGLECVLGSRGSLVVRSVGSGVGSARRALTGLLEDVDVVVGHLSAPVANAISGLFHPARKRLLAVGSGAHAVAPHASSPWVFHLTLQTWQACWAVGAWAARHLGPRVLVAASPYDSGFDMVSAARLGAEQGGGTVQSIYLSHLSQDAADLPHLMAAVRRYQPHYVHALYCGAEARQFLAAWRASGLSGGVPLVVSPFMAGEPDLPPGTVSSACWDATDPATRTAGFVSAYRSRHGRDPDAFAMLGHDAGLLLQQARWDRPEASLDRIDFTGARGRLRMDPVSRSVLGPLFIRRHPGSTQMPVVVERVEVPSPQDGRFASLRTGVQSTLLNEYLFA